MKQFLAQYFFNLWVYGSQAMILFFAARKLVTIYATKQIEKKLAARGYNERGGIGVIRDERAS